MSLSSDQEDEKKAKRRKNKTEKVFWLVTVSDMLATALLEAFADL